MPDAKGRVSPTTSSSGQRVEDDPKTIEYYVKGGENMTDNNIGVTSTPDDSYGVPEGSTTEPDPQSNLAMQKASCCADCQGAECDKQCCDKCMGMTKATDQQVDDEENEPAKDVEELEKSAWAGFFKPGLPTAALRTVFRIED